MDLDRAIKTVGLVNAVLTTVLITLWVIAAFRSVVVTAEVAGIPLVPPLAATQPSPETVGKAIISLLYTVFKYVIYAVIVITGIYVALGLVANFVTAFLPITVPRATLNTLIKNILALFIIKLVVDASLSYFGYSADVAENMAVLEGVGGAPSLLLIAAMVTGVAVAVYLVYRALKKRLGEVEVVLE
ncbi:hypothetical protein [Thermofilum pendens]|uniref:Uncharacterized protein n=1 Tax=Thermofilum pendens (strain DSM 2475 / Hrk 5) TaxID=368408 RepID=A1S1A8_THEPD|nr:hypothetical protein [Thermofilum pendens]ABL79238.1 hypothetical protein Tpen_1843 [Thermofilum pendens Hrk 5]